MRVCLCHICANMWTHRTHKHVPCNQFKRNVAFCLLHQHFGWIRVNRNHHRQKTRKGALTAKQLLLTVTLLSTINYVKILSNVTVCASIAKTSTTYPLNACLKDVHTHAKTIALHFLAPLSKTVSVADLIPIRPSSSVVVVPQLFFKSLLLPKFWSQPLTIWHTAYLGQSAK